MLHHSWVGRTYGRVTERMRPGARTRRSGSMPSRKEKVPVLHFQLCSLQQLDHGPQPIQHDVNLADKSKVLESDRHERAARIVAADVPDPDGLPGVIDLELDVRMLQQVVLVQDRPIASHVASPRHATVRRGCDRTAVPHAAADELPVADRHGPLLEARGLISQIGSKPAVGKRVGQYM